MKHMMKTLMTSPDFVLLVAFVLYLVIGMATYNNPDVLHFSLSQLV